MYTIFFWAPAVTWGAGAFTVDRDQSLTLLMHELGWLTFITPLCVFPMQTLSLAYVSLTMKEESPVPAFPRWVAFLSILLGTENCASLFAMVFQSGPLAWTGLCTFYMPSLCTGFGPSHWRLPCREQYGIKSGLKASDLWARTAKTSVDRNRLQAGRDYPRCRFSRSP
jgi:hypothetical protein